MAVETLAALVAVEALTVTMEVPEVTNKLTITNVMETFNLKDLVGLEGLEVPVDPPVDPLVDLPMGPQVDPLMTTTTTTVTTKTMEMAGMDYQIQINSSAM